MRRHLWIVMASALGLALGLAAQEQAGQGRLIVFEGVTPQNAPTVFSSSERLVWDRQTGVAVAEILGAHMGRIKSFKAHDLGPSGEPGSFAKALASYLPAYGQESAAGEASQGRFAGVQPMHLVRPAGMPKSRPAAVERVTPEDTCLYEGFENLPIWYEDGGPWWHYRGGQPDNAVGNYFWMDTNCDAFNGSWDCEAIMGGDTGLTLPCGADYDSNTDSWLEYAPWIACLYGAPGAEQRFYAKVQTLDDADYFFYGFAANGFDYFGYSYWGNYGDTWYEYHRDLRTWYQLGDLTTYPQVTMAFAFESDTDGSQGFGTRLDDLSLSLSSIGITAVQAVGSPFRLFVAGAGFLPGATIAVDGVRVPTTVYKNSSMLVAKGGAALKAMVPRGTWVTVSVMNPDGTTSTGYDFIR